MDFGPVFGLWPSWANKNPPPLRRLSITQIEALRLRGTARATIWRAWLFVKFLKCRTPG